MSRRRRVRKHKSKISAESGKALAVVFIWIGAALFAVLLALFVGNLLGDIADSIDLSDGAPPIYEYGGEAVGDISAALFEIRGHSDDSLAAAVANLAEGCDISITLNDSSGTMNYRSQIALSVTGNIGGTCDLTAALSAFKARGIYVSGCFYSSFASAGSNAARLAAIEYEAALIAEAIDAGVDDVVIFGLPTDSDGIAYASSLFSKVREKASRNAYLGAAVSYSRFDIGDAAYAIEAYNKFTDFCAIDASGVSSLGTTAAGAAEKILYYFERYPLRLIIADGGYADRELQIKALAGIGIYNIQSVGKISVAG